jgi:hypothetical protein
MHEPEVQRVDPCGCRHERRSDEHGTGDVIVQCDEHRAQTNASVDAFEDRRQLERDHALQRALDYEIDERVRERAKRFRT